MNISERPFAVEQLTAMSRELCDCTQLVLTPWSNEASQLGWQPVTALLADTLDGTALLNAEVDNYCRRLETDERWVGASLMFGAWARRLMHFYGGSVAVDGAIPDLAAGRVMYQVGEVGRVALSVPTLVPVNIERGWQALYDEHLIPLGEAIRRQVRIGRGVINANLAAAMASTLRTLEKTGHGPLEQLIEQPWTQRPELMPRGGEWTTTPDGLEFQTKGVLRLRTSQRRAQTLCELQPQQAPRADGRVSKGDARPMVSLRSI